MYGAHSQLREEARWEQVVLGGDAASEGQAAVVAFEAKVKGMAASSKEAVGPVKAAAGPTGNGAEPEPTSKMEVDFGLVGVEEVGFSLSWYDSRHQVREEETHESSAARLEVASVLASARSPCIPHILPTYTWHPRIDGSSRMLGRIRPVAVVAAASHDESPCQQGQCPSLSTYPSRTHGRVTVKWRFVT